MLPVVGQILPLALALAMSSVPLMATVTILMSPQATRSSGWFLIGWLLGMFAIAAVFSFGLHAVSFESRSTQDVTIGIAELVVGVGLIVYAIWRFARRRGFRASPGANKATPRWLRAVASIRPLGAFGLALALNIRPKSLLLAAAAGLAVGPSGLPPTQIAIVLVIFVVVGSSTVGVPIVMALANPERTRRMLRSAGDWTRRNSRIVTLVVMIVIGTVIFGNGLGRL